MVNSELYHWGIKGQKWGIRRFQNKDGSLTPLGRKRYDQEVEKLNKKAAKIAEAEKIAANRKEVKSMKDSLKAQKAELAKRKKALKGKSEEEIAKEKAKENESVEERRERLLKSTDAKEIYEGRNLLTTQELNDRINRIDTEARLQGKIPTEKKKTAIDHLNTAKQYIDSSRNLYKSVDDAYSTVLNSTIGKTLADKLGLSTPKESWFKERYRKYKEGKMNAQEMQEFNRYLVAEGQAVNNLSAREARIAAEREVRRTSDSGTESNTNNSGNSNNTNNADEENRS